MKRNITRTLIAGLIAATSVPALAVVDYSGITGAVDVSTVSAAIVAMGVIMVGPNVARWATRKLVGFFR